MNFLEKNIFKDELGFLSLIDSLFAILLVFMAILSFNLITDMEIPSLSEESYDLKISQDTFELMAMDINGNDYSTLESIVYVLKINNNSKSSIKTVASISEDFFNSHIFNKHYYFIETDQLNGIVLAKNGDLATASNVSVAIRNYGNYSFKLYVW